jgi:hypothetical protein
MTDNKILIGPQPSISYISFPCMEWVDTPGLGVGCALTHNDPDLYLARVCVAVEGQIDSRRTPCRVFSEFLVSR